MSTLLDFKVSFSQVSCCECSGVFMMTGSAVARLKNKKGDFWCPYCNQIQGWYGDNKEERLKKQLKDKETTISFLNKQNEKERNRTRAQKAAKTRLKNRVKNGVCPCCTRSFKNLREHMAHMHPEYKKRK